MATHRAEFSHSLGIQRTASLRSLRSLRFAAADAERWVAFHDRTAKNDF